jgi:hypothetical protein
VKRKSEKPPLIDKTFKVRIDVIEDLQALALVHGSNGRAIQVGTELLIRMGRKPRIRDDGGSVPVAAQTYSILPRTLDLIERLLPCYEKRGTVLKAVVQVLQEQP